MGAPSFHSHSFFILPEVQLIQIRVEPDIFFIHKYMPYLKKKHVLMEGNTILSGPQGVPRTQTLEHS